MTVLRMLEVDLAGKRVLIREDLNVPVADGAVTSDARIRASLPTIEAALDAGAAVMLMSHLGRPTEGEPNPEFSLQPVATRLAELLGRDVPLIIYLWYCNSGWSIQRLRLIFTRKSPVMERFAVACNLPESSWGSVVFVRFSCGRVS